MKNIVLSLLTLFTCTSTFAIEVFYSPENISQFSCKISRAIKKKYPKLTKRKLRKNVMRILREEIDQWVDAYPIPAGISFPRYLERITGIPGFPMDRSEYYLQNAFILFGNPELKLVQKSKNYFSSFIHLARTKYIQYLNGEIQEFKLREESDLLIQLEEHLPSIANNTFPYLDQNGRQIRQEGEVKKERDRFYLAIGNTSHKKYDQFIYESQRYNHFSSSLFLWLLKQSDFSVTPEMLFDKALIIYQDPFVALGVISWIFSGDALTVNRRTSSVISYKMVKLVEGHDIAGYQYHFWGYLTQSIIGNRIRVATLAYLYERLYQRDIPDWKVDVISLKLGRQVRKNLSRPDRCP